MNKNKNILKLLKILITALLMFIPLMTACAGLQTTSPPTPPVKFPFDVSKKGNTVNQEFMIGDKPYYGFELRFNYFGREDEYRVFELVGNGSSKYPGIDIPIHIKIYKLNTGNVPPELVPCNSKALSYRPTGDILHLYTIIKISRFASK